MSHWLKPVSTFGLSMMTTFIEVHLRWSLPLVPSPSPPLCWQILLSLAGPRTDDIGGYIVPRASHRAVAGSACLGRKRLMEQPVQSQRITLRRTEIQATCRSHMRFHAEVPLIAFLGRAHLGIALTARVLGRTGRGDQRGINDRTRFEQQALAAKHRIDRCKHLGGKLVLLKQMPESQDRTLVRQPHVPVIQCSKLSKQRHVMQRFFHRGITQGEPLLHEMDAQHRLYWKRRSASLTFGCMRRHQRHQFGPRNHTVHLVEELPLTRSLGRQIQSQISLFHSTIVAVVGPFGNPILHDLCRPSLMNRINAPFPYWRYVKLPRDRRLNHSLVEVHRFVRLTMNRARERIRGLPHDEPGNLLEAMLQIRDTPGSGFTDDQVATNVLTMLLAGEDTTAHSIAWALLYLTSDDALQSRVSNRSRAVLGAAGVCPTYETLKTLDLCEAVCTEASRFRPVVPVHAFEPLQDVEHRGIRLPAGSRMFFLTRPSMLDASNFEHPDKFDPERWMHERISERGAHETRAHLQFGGGPRVCFAACSRYEFYSRGGRVYDGAEWDASAALSTAVNVRWHSWVLPSR